MTSRKNTEDACNSMRNMNFYIVSIYIYIDRYTHVLGHSLGLSFIYLFKLIHPNGALPYRKKLL